jgi:cytochrome c oxidase subunit IV
MAEHHPFDPRSPGHGYEAAAADHDHGHAGIGKYVMVFVALCVLTLVSFLVGNSETLRQNSPGAMWAMMMAVSCAKAMLVILFFMHLLWEANWKYVLTIPSAMMSIFLLLMLIPDIGRRTDRYSEERWLYAAEPKPTPPPAEDDAAHEAHDHKSDEHKAGPSKQPAKH